ncbi:MAG: Na+/H+ antiporter NhaC family protein, partial [Deferribacterota bacterium]|nr:Na+/H+ antiporter NhaC family protein [Deferribacterota bacterium]
GYGTVVAFCMLLYPAGVAIGSDPIVLLGAILSGAAFGDNLAPVSDTTIVSAVTQRTDIIGVVRSRFKYAVAAAIPAMILFLIFGGSDMTVKNDILSTGAFGRPEGLILLIPFALVLLIAFRGHHIITSLTWGIISSVILIYIADLCPMKNILWFNLKEGRVEGALLDGVLGYVNMAVLILLVVALGYIVNIGGTMDAIRRFTISKIKGVVARAEIAMWALVGILNSLITINTAAEILASTFVYDIGNELKIHPYRRANFLDSMTSALGYIFPWAGGTLLGIVSIQGLTSKYSFVQAVNPIEVVPYVFHGWLLVIVMLIAAITGWGRRFIGPNGEEVKSLKG